MSAVGASAALGASHSHAHSSPPTAARDMSNPWHSPVPYLFGGVAAMLALIAFAILILACSYWNNLSGDRGDRDLEAGGHGCDKAAAASTTPVVVEEKYLVIMAGQDKPTFLATPVVLMSNVLASSFSSSSRENINNNYLSSSEGNCCTCDQFKNVENGP